MSVKVITTGYTPRKFQDQIHRAMKRFTVLVCHRRFGKTVLAINEMVDQGFRCKLKNPQYAYLAPFYGQAKKVAWDMLKDACKNIPGVTFNEAELRVDIPRADRGDRIRFMLLGADNPNAIRGMYFDGVILDEFAEMNPYVWTQVIRPALSDRLGWALFIGTPKGQNHFYDIYMHAKRKAAEGEDWYHALFKASETKIIAESELLEAKAGMTEEEYDQEFECSFSAALIGAYYGKEMEMAESSGRITTVPYERNYPVETAWDLGMDDSTAIWFIQEIGRERRVIDYLEDSGRDIAFYAGELKKKGYVYAERALLPHDVAVREMGTGRSRIETFRTHGIRAQVVPKQRVEDGINAVRLLLPKMWFDEKKCERGIACLKNYERAWDPKNKIFSSNPKHNWASHGADAMRTYAMGNVDADRKKNMLHLPRRAITDYNVLD